VTDKTAQDLKTTRIVAERSREARKILKVIGKASIDYNLIEPGDKILVACSGGKDSYTLLWALNKIRQRVPFSFEIIPINIDPGFGGFKQETIGKVIKSLGFEPQLAKEYIGDICRHKISEGDNACWMCARLRRGALYSHAKKLGCNKLALGHHANDSIETLMLNLFYSSQIKAMPPRLRTNDGEMVVIRPMIYVYEETIISFAKKMAFETVNCDCPHSDHESSSQREVVKQMLDKLSDTVPDLQEHLLSSLKRVRPSHLLDKDLFSFDD